MTAARGGRQRERELESEILAAVWAADRVLTAAEIRAQLGSEPAPGTVHAVLRRLCAQDLIQPARDADGAYEPVRNAAETTAQVMHQALGPHPAAACRAPGPEMTRPRRRRWSLRSAGTPPVRQSPPAPVPPARPRGDLPRCPHTSQP
ncbi:BlaI/MecI/CopY family transcriptional regulator [Streptomyces sp. NPDC001100]